MAIPRNLGNLAQGANSSGVLGTSKGGTGLTSVGTNGQVLQSNGSALVFADASSGALGVNVQTFTSSGTWTKPAGYTANSRVLLQAWGGGGSGQKGYNTGGCDPFYQNGNGGGGGGYNYSWLLLSDLSATESITIGAGGASTSSPSAYNSGGNTTVGSKITGYGGTTAKGGGLLPSNSPLNDYEGAGGQTNVLLMDSNQKGGGGGYAYGSYGTSPNPGSRGGNSYWGGGGGGGSAQVVSGGVGGTSAMAGAGGVGGNNSANGTNGVYPSGGGGGGGVNSAPGAGANGRVTITVFAGV